MADLTPQQAADVQTMMANVEAAYRSTNAAKTALSVLINASKATCQDVKTYNLQVKAVYAYQASVAGIIKAQGGSSPPIPAPTYVAYRGVGGDQAANIDCSSAQMRGWAPVGGGIQLDGRGLGDFYVNPDHVEWRQEVLPGDQALVNQVVAAGRAALQQGSGRMAGPLGIAPLVVVAIILVGIIIAVAGYIVLKIVETLMDIPGKIETTKQIATQADEHKRTLEARSSCYTDCASRGKDPIECGKACDRLLPNFVAQYPGGGWGIFGTVAGVAVLGLVIYAGYRYARGGGFSTGGHAGGHRQLPRGGHDIDEDDVIDAEYTEHAA